MSFAAHAVITRLAPPPENDQAQSASRMTCCSGFSEKIMEVTRDQKELFACHQGVNRWEELPRPGHTM